MTDPETAQSESHHELLEHIEDGDVHDNLLGHMNEDESPDEALRRLLFALPSWNDLECMNCGRNLDPLDETDWIAWRLRVEDSDLRRTDLYCGLGCLVGATEALELSVRPDEIRGEQ